jgi:hypothetical protein
MRLSSNTASLKSKNVNTNDARRLAWRLRLQAITGTAPDGADVEILGASAIDLRFLWKAQLDPWQVLIGAR